MDWCGRVGNHSTWVAVVTIPNRQLTTSPTGIALIKKFEGCELTAYLCPANVVTVGFGHTGSGVKLGDTITQAQADELLAKDLIRFENVVFNSVRFGLSQHEFDSLVSFAFNVGVTAFRNSSLVNYINRGMKLHAGLEFQKWTKATVGGKKVELPGLVARREAERNLFLGNNQEVVT